MEDDELAQLTDVVERFCHDNAYGSHEANCQVDRDGGECGCYLKPLEDALLALEA